MQPRNVVLILTLSMIATAVAFVPTGSAHYCRSWIPSDCGPCTSGDHDHTYCSSFDVCNTTNTNIALDPRVGSAIALLEIKGEIAEIVC